MRQGLDRFVNSRARVERGLEQSGGSIEDEVQGEGGGEGSAQKEKLGLRLQELLRVSSPGKLSPFPVLAQVLASPVAKFIRSVDQHIRQRSQGFADRLRLHSVSRGERRQRRGGRRRRRLAKPLQSVPFRRRRRPHR